MVLFCEKSCDQDLTVHMPSDVWWPSGWFLLRWIMFTIPSLLVMWTGGLNIPLANLPMTPSCQVQMAHQREDAIQRDLDRFETWTCMNIMKFNPAKCKAPHISRDFCGWQEVQHEVAMYSCSPKSQLHPGLHQKKRDWAGWRRFCPSSPHFTCIQLWGPSAQEGPGLVVVGP